MQFAIEGKHRKKKSQYPEIILTSLLVFEERMNFFSPY